ncbi:MULTISPECIES: TonB family protein [Kordiimonas]|jgi:TonB family protein|uniref:TonB family protein n=1 Tax=Kordiimonas TaxID=288021 RepID=UPI00257A8AC6|nr:TonB family protein [Kordiimonas sp. UBA4487]
MTTSFLKKSAFGAAALSVMLLGGAAQAGHNGGLDAWAESAGSSIDKVMKYPAFAARKGDQGYASFRVTVNRAGDVIASDLLQRTDSALLNSAAMRVVAKADFPALPAEFDGEKLTFSLQLNYALAGSAMEQRNLMREGRVTGSEVASNRGPVTASISFEGASAD